MAVNWETERKVTGNFDSCYIVSYPLLHEMKAKNYLLGFGNEQIGKTFLWGKKFYTANKVTLHVAAENLKLLRTSDLITFLCDKKT